MAERVHGFAGYEPRSLEIIDTTLREGAQTSLMHDYTLGGHLGGQTLFLVLGVYHWMLRRREHPR